MTARETQAKSGVELDAAATKALRADRAALAFHEKQPPAYRRLVAPAACAAIRMTS